MSMRRRFAKDTVATGLVHILISVRGLIIIPIIIKTVGATVFGGYSLLVSSVTLLVGASSLGTYVRYRRFFPSERDTQRRAAIFYPQLGFHLGLSLLLAGGLVL